MRAKPIGVLALALSTLVIVGEARAVIVITDTPNGTVQYTVLQIPGGQAPAGSGAAYEGSWQPGVGTAVGPNEFLTATHLGGSVGDTFGLNGTNYTTTGSVDVGNGMTLWYVNGTFSSYATVFGNSSTTNSVTGATAADFGGGLGPNLTNGQVYAPGSNNSTVVGYTYQGGIGLSYGPGQIGSYYTYTSGDDQSGTYFLTGGFLPNSTYGTRYGSGYASFTLALGDSGGGLYAKQSNGTWVLVGVNYGVDNLFATDSSGSNQFSAALWNENGYYEQDNTGAWLPASGPQTWFADAITPQVAANIEAAIAAVPEPAALPLLSAGLALAALAYRRRKSRALPPT